MIRVISGKAKGRKLEVPDIPATRPVTDRIKTVVFDLLKDHIEGGRVLDLYSGSGAYGIEALSRGAQNCVFIDNHYLAEIAIKNNLEKCGFSEQGRVIKAKLPVTKETYESATKNEAATEFDLIFCDPPFKEAYSLDYTYIKDFMAPDSLFILRLPSSDSQSPSSKQFQNFKIVYQRQIGTSTIIFLKL